MTGLLESCQNYVVTKQSNTTHWHEVLGWFAQPIDQYLQASMNHIKEQLSLLWNNDMIQIILGNYLSELVAGSEPPQPTLSPTNPNNPFLNTGIFKKVLEARSNRNNVQRNWRALGSPEVHRIVLICSLYHTALNTLTQLQLDILTGLCYQNNILYDLWLFICSLGPNCGLRTFLDHLAFNTKGTAPEFQLLQLFCDCMRHYVTYVSVRCAT